MTHLAAVYYLIEILGLGLAILVGWGTARVFKTKSIKDIVETATTTIDLYEKKDKAQENKIDELETKIDNLESKIDSLQESLNRALAQNDLLQSLLLKAGVDSVKIPLREPTVGSNESPAPSNTN